MEVSNLQILAVYITLHNNNSRKMIKINPLQKKMNKSINQSHTGIMISLKTKKKIKHKKTKYKDFQICPNERKKKHKHAFGSINKSVRLTCIGVQGILRFSSTHQKHGKQLLTQTLTNESWNSYQ